MRVLIADDNELLRRGIAKLLSSDEELEVCGEASNSSETLQKADELLPDLILLDISMPGMNGLNTAKLLRENFLDLKFLSLVSTIPTYYYLVLSKPELMVVSIRRESLPTYCPH